MPTKENINQNNSNGSDKGNNSSGGSNKRASVLEHSAVHKPVPGKGGKGGSGK